MIAGLRIGRACNHAAGSRVPAAPRVYTVGLQPHRRNRTNRAMAEAAAPRHDPAAVKAIAANAENRYAVGRADLPLSCPMPGMALWNSHPKVYLAVEATGSAKCPYCGAMYFLEG